MAMIQCPECRCEISERARVCPGCGYPIRENEYYIRPGNAAKSGFAIFLKVIAILILIGGIILSGGMAFVMSIFIGKTSTGAAVSFITFITAMIPYVFGAFITWCIGTVVAEVREIHSMIEGMGLYRGKVKEKNQVETERHSQARFTGRPWRCSKCGTVNQGDARYCGNCGEQR